MSCIPPPGPRRLFSIRLEDDMGNDLTREELRTMVRESGAMIPESGTSRKLYGHGREKMHTAKNAVKTVKYYD